METVYGEKEALDDALTSVKTATGNYNTFSNECVHENVRNVMLKILEQEHEIQDDVMPLPRVVKEVMTMLFSLTAAE